MSLDWFISMVIIRLSVMVMMRLYSAIVLFDYRVECISWSVMVSRKFLVYILCGGTSRNWCFGLSIL